ERLSAGQSLTTRVIGYFGPKDLALLAAAGHGLPETVNLGFFSFIARGLLAVLNFLHGIVGNWGIAIILLTVLVKLVLFPLTARSFKSMEKMRALKPELDRLNELYKDDREKKGAATMELYRKAGVNPFGGCLPSLAQLPVWWALYTTLQISVELYRAPFLVWSDLSAPDPFYVMPLVLGGLMFLQQRLTPTTMDPMQAKIMMYAMPVMFTAFMLFLPVGLCLYMTVNSALSILQQQLVMRSANKAAVASAPVVDPSPKEGGDDDGRTSTPSRDPKPRRKSRGGR
ncbi:MAG: membrane protein insertase YidC, partial [Deltaproteobacteria bacterium]|nr:membrane protein insertase YidC [Deltaproteobacteria bacterium]